MGGWPRGFHQARTVVPTVLNLSVLAFFFGLDVRDILYKLVWLGPSTNFSFQPRQGWLYSRNHFSSRRPPICQQTIVSDFHARYGISALDVPLEWISDPGSDAEVELLEMLDVIGASTDLARVVCVEGFQLDHGPGRYVSTVFGCGSATYFRSAMIGYHATSIVNFLADKSWLTVDHLSFLELGFAIRQNDISEFTVSTTPDGHLDLEHFTQINFSSYGALYCLLVATDMLLLWLNVFSAGEDSPVEMMSRSLFRSTPVVVLTVMSHVLWWLMILPNVIVFTWTEDTVGQIQACLTSVRVWVLVVLLVNSVWDSVALVHERLAYQLVKRSYVSMLEVMAVAGLVAYGFRYRVFSIGSVKYGIEKQRVVDVDTFAGWAVFANTYNDDLDTIITTRLDVISAIYGPLAQILGTSLGGVVAVLVLKGIFIHLYQSARMRLHVVADKQAGSKPVSAQSYERLPLERLLNTAIRARSLMRNGLEVESVHEGELFIGPSLYFDFGLIVQERAQSKATCRRLGK
ncbi:TPA: hypothetical protein N0F65_006747 [Lagenidium giganteum]|uniref:Uncharacterized protein n=1 Tax=Lagenidium giganteum TaxID=4803 RepID=A0AAV2YX38_9STRA|nr:TPA: hypothetical protein N0F65_006747 [Lagenidium giganteum]